MATTVNVPEEVIEILKRCTMTATSVKLPTGQLPRALYDSVNKVFTAAGGRWDRKSGTHVFTRDPRELIGMASETGKAVNIQQTLQSFYTPLSLSARMAGLANIKRLDRVLEPSAGEGALADAARALGGVVDCIEIDKHAVAVLAGKGFGVREVDFLKVPPYPDYDVVLMNPPFQRGQACSHTFHALGFLKPGGRLVGLMDAGVASRTDKATTNFLNHVARFGAKFERIPAGTFSESGTEVATMMISLMLPKA